MPSVSTFRRAQQRPSCRRPVGAAAFAAEDAVPLSPNPLPNKHEGLLVRGRTSGRARSVAFDLRLPQRPTSGSFFNQQVGLDG